MWKCIGSRTRVCSEDVIRYGKNGSLLVSEKRAGGMYGILRSALENEGLLEVTYRSDLTFAEKHQSWDLVARKTLVFVQTLKQT